MSEADPDAAGIGAAMEALEETQRDDEKRAPGSEVGPPGAHALVPRGGVFEGQVAIVGSTRIDGGVRGSLRGPGNLIVGSQARIEGRIECESLESGGEIVGPVSVRTRARLGAGARLDGDLHAPIVLFDEDAVWNGRALIGEDDRAESKAPDEGSSDSA
jgi:cytoskeletal protein CcmA (bactofilin family)